MNDAIEITNRATWNDVMTYGSESDAVALLVPAARILAGAGFTLLENCPPGLTDGGGPAYGAQLRITGETTVRMSWQCADDAALGTAEIMLAAAGGVLSTAGFVVDLQPGGDAYLVTGRR